MPDTEDAHLNRSVEIIVSRLSEEVSWLSEILEKIPEIKISLYNKGNPLKVFDEKMISKNVGRESSIFFQHIIENYENLSDIMIFCQGHPFDHCPDFINRVCSKVGEDDNLSFVALKEPYKIENRNDTWRSSGVRTWYGKTTKEKYDHSWKKLFVGDVCPDNLSVFNCQFIVSKERIRFRSLDFYKRCLSLVDYSLSPPEAWIFERFYEVFFDGATKDKF